MSALARLFQRNTDPPSPEPEQRNISISDPSVLTLFGGAPSLSGVSVTEQSALGLSAVYRSVALIAGTIGTLPLRTLQDGPDGTRDRVPSFLDNPGGPLGPTPYEWAETVLCHLALHGNCYLAHIFGGAGQLIGLQPIHPMAVTPEILKDGTRIYRVTLSDGKVEVFDQRSMTHIPALSTDGIKGLSPIQVAKNSFGTSIAADRSAAKLFGNGALMSAIASVEDEMPEDEAKAIKDGLDRRIAGEANAGQIAFINRSVKITPWSLSPEDSQFIQGRAFQVEEVARWYGIPPHLLAQTEKQTSWGTGVSEQNRGLARYTLEPWTTRVQQRLSRLLPPNRKCEFDFTAFVQPDPETEIKLLIEQVQAGLITTNEARRIRNMPPLPEPTQQETNAD